MSRSSVALIFLSAVVAVVLWFLATALETWLRAPDRAPDPATAPEPVEERPADADPAGAEAGDCQETEDRLVRIVEESRYCVSDEDCTLFDYGYPIDCMTSVAKSRISLLREEYRKYDESCEFRVFFDCPTEPYVRLPVCRDNRCVVELDSNRAPPAPLTGRRLDLRDWKVTERCRRFRPYVSAAPARAPSRKSCRRLPCRF
jgi:hypothetical protein